MLGRLKNVVDTFDVEVGFLLTGKRGIGQILRRGRRANRKRRIRVIPGELGIGVANLLLQCRLEWRVSDECAHHRAGCGQCA